MCNSRTTRCLLALVAFAVIGCQASYAAQTLLLGGGVSTGQTTIHVGNTYTSGTMTFTQVSIPSESTTLAGSIRLVPACKITPAPGSDCPAGQLDAGVITVNSVASDTTMAGNACTSATTWTVINNGDGSFTITPSGTVTFAVSGATCTLDWSFTVNKLATADSNPATPTVLDTTSTDAAGTTDGTNTAGGVGTTTTAFTFTCAAKVDKQVSCDNGATWSDVGEESANNDGTNGCIGGNSATVKVRYLAENISDSGITLSACTISDTNSGFPGVSTAFTIGNNGTGGGASTLETGVLNTSAGAACTTAHAGETTAGVGDGILGDTATLSCACAIPALNNPPLGSSTPGVGAPPKDSLTFDCCASTLNKEISCDSGATFINGSTGQNNAFPSSCTGLVGTADIQVKYVTTTTTGSTVTPSCGSVTDSNTHLVAGSNVECMLAHNGTGTTSLEPDTASESCTCTGTGANHPTLMLNLQSSNNFDCCGGTLNKEISCDGGATYFNGTTGAGSPPISCVGIAGASDIVAKYVFTSTGTLTPSCNAIVDSNTTLTTSSATNLNLPKSDPCWLGIAALVYTI